MTKTLTEQWREGKLPSGHYYCKLYYNDFEPRIQECVKSRYDSKSCIPMSCGCEGEEVLAPVPSYEKHNELVQKMHILKKQLEVALEVFGIIAMHSKDPVDAVQAACAISKIKEMEDVK